MTKTHFLHIIEAMFSKDIHDLRIMPSEIDLVRKKEVPDYENDISAEKEIKGEGSWIQIQNEYGWREKGFSCQKSKGKKSSFCIRSAAQ